MLTDYYELAALMLQRDCACTENFQHWNQSIKRSRAVNRKNLFLKVEQKKTHHHQFKYSTGKQKNPHLSTSVLSYHLPGSQNKSKPLERVRAVHERSTDFKVRLR